MCAGVGYSVKEHKEKTVYVMQQCDDTRMSVCRDNYRTRGNVLCWQGIVRPCITLCTPPCNNSYSCISLRTFPPARHPTYAHKCAHARPQISQSFNCVALCGSSPVQLGLKDMLAAFLEFRWAAGGGGEGEWAVNTSPNYTEPNAKEREGEAEGWDGVGRGGQTELGRGPRRGSHACERFVGRPAATPPPLLLTRPCPLHPPR